MAVDSACLDVAQQAARQLLRRVLRTAAVLSPRKPTEPHELSGDVSRAGWTIEPRAVVAALRLQPAIGRDRWLDVLLPADGPSAGVLPPSAPGSPYAVPMPGGGDRDAGAVAPGGPELSPLLLWAQRELSVLLHEVTAATPQTPRDARQFSQSARASAPLSAQAGVEVVAAESVAPEPPVERRAVAVNLLDSFAEAGAAAAAGKAAPAVVGQCKSQRVPVPSPQPQGKRQSAPVGPAPFVSGRIGIHQALANAIAQMLAIEPGQVTITTVRGSSMRKLVLPCLSVVPRACLRGAR